MTRAAEVCSESSSAAPEHDLFVIYADADSAFVREYLLPALELPRERVLLIDELPLGGLVVQEIDRGVSRSRYTVAVLSPAYLEDRWADFGVELASHLSRRETRVVPLRLIDCELPLRLDARVALDFTDRSRWEWETARLRDLLRLPAPDSAPVRYPDPRRRALRRWLLGLIAGVAVGALLVLTIAWLWSSPPAVLAHAPAHSPGMVRFAETSVRLGVFDAAAMPAECRGLVADEGCPAVDHPEAVRATRVDAFELDRYEVTNSEYAAWLNAHVDLWKLAPYGIVTTRGEPAIPLVRTEKCGDALTITPEHRARTTADAARWPVVCVTWSGADEYCRAQGKRLPLDREWEVAAKGAAGRPFPWGAELPRRDVVAFGLRDVAAVHPRDVGSSPQDVSPDGIYDLGGNVAEWVEDGRGDARLKVLRGGGFGGRRACDLLGARCARVEGDSFKRDAGFRCARSVIDQRLEGGRP
jgi:formylglycine-generating enzyme required for sulfatase activity